MNLQRPVEPAPHSLLARCRRFRSSRPRTRAGVITGIDSRRDHMRRQIDKHRVPESARNRYIRIKAGSR